MQDFVHQQYFGYCPYSATVGHEFCRNIALHITPPNIAVTGWGAVPKLYSSTLNPKPSTLNPKPSTLNPKP